MNLILIKILDLKLLFCFMQPKITEESREPLATDSLPRLFFSVPPDVPQSGKLVHCVMCHVHSTFSIIIFNAKNTDFYHTLFPITLPIL